MKTFVQQRRQDGCSILEDYVRDAVGAWSFVGMKLVDAAVEDA